VGQNKFKGNRKLHFPTGFIFGWGRKLVSFLLSLQWCH